MKRTVPALTVIAALALAGAAANAESENAASVINLADLDLDFTHLPTTPQKYTVRMHGKSFDKGKPFPFDSSMTLQTRYDGASIVFNDTVEFVGRSVTFSFHCEPEATLTIERGQIRMDHAARTISADVVHNDDDDTLNVTSGAGKTNTVEYPDGTVTEAALFRIIPRLPRTPGHTYAFSAYTPMNEVRPATPEDGGQCTITCRGPSTIEIDRTPVQCTQYVANFEGELTFFVDANDVVRKVFANFGQTEMTWVPTPSDTAFAEVEDE